MYDRELCIIVHVGDSLLLPVVYRYYMYGMIVIHNMLGPLCDKRFDSIQGERHNNNSSSSSSSRRWQATTDDSELRIPPHHLTLGSTGALLFKLFQMNIGAANW